jgi:hypothetical protein
LEKVESTEPNQKAVQNDIQRVNVESKNQFNFVLKLENPSLSDSAINNKKNKA